MKPKEGHTSSLINPESVVSRFCTVFLEAGWIAAAVLSALFVNIFTKEMFELDKAVLIRSIAILMFIAWLIKTIESRPAHKDAALGSKIRLMCGTILLPAGLYLFSYLISTLTSVLPTTSFWGSYERMQGLYTTIGYFVIFILAATHLKSRVQVERLISAIILTSLPVMVYGLIQKLGWDPVPWQRVPTKRIYSTIGNPIFLAAYLIMVVPLTLARLLQHIKRIKHPETRFGGVTVGFYGLVLFLQIVSIILTQSRGPLLGLISGIAFFLFIYALLYKKKVLVWGLVGGLILGTIFVVIFNLPNTPLKPLKKVPYLERLGRLNPSEGSARVRLIYWGNALKLMRETYLPAGKAGQPHRELIDAHPWRFLLGYGPGTPGNIFYRYHTAELTKHEGRIVYGDHCHNSLFQAFVTQGVFGLIAFLCLISGAIYLGLKTLKSTSDGLRILLLGIISTIIAHFVESLLGIGVVPTYTHFWLFLALLHYFTQHPTQPHTYSRPAQKSSPECFRGAGLFWVYLGVSFVIIAIVVKEYWPSFDTNVRPWIIGTYLWILLGILLGAISLYFSPGGMSRHKVSGSTFNLLGYLCLVIAAFFIIIRSNFNLVLADGYSKFGFDANTEVQVIYKKYHAQEFKRLVVKQKTAGLSVAEKKQLESITDQAKEMVSLVFRLRLESIVAFQHALRLVPNEKTYLHGMGQNFLELAKTWRTIKSLGWTIRDVTTTFGTRDMNVPGQLNGPPSIKEIMDFPTEQYHKFNQYDFFYCSLAAMHKAYELEPTNYGRRFVLARIYHYGTLMTRHDDKIEESDEYFEKAMGYYQEAREASPGHPVVKEYIKVLQKEMEKKH